MQVVEREDDEGRKRPHHSTPAGHGEPAKLGSEEPMWVVVGGQRVGG